MASPDHGLYGVLQAAGLLFFAFAGYARIATLGEEVREPERVIPRAIVMALAGAVVVYAVVAVAVLSVLGPVGTAASAAPVADAVRAVGDPWAVGVVRVGAALASAGALLALVAGLGRTGLAMARERDLPGWLDAVHPRFRVPHRAELTVAAVVVVLVLTTDLRGAIGFSSFGVLLYYFVANAAAYAAGQRARRFPRWLQLLGCTGCLVLVATLPWAAVVDRRWPSSRSGSRSGRWLDGIDQEVSNRSFATRAPPGYGGRRITDNGGASHPAAILH